MEKPKMSLEGIGYRLETLEYNIKSYEYYKTEEFKDGIQNSKNAIKNGVEQRDKYIQYLECALAKAEHELKELKQPKPQYHLYEVTNGYQGYVPVSVEVMAEDEKKAYAAASVAFRHHSEERAMGGIFGYSSDFWLDLKVRLVKENAGTHECTFEVKR